MAVHVEIATLDEDQPEVLWPVALTDQLEVSPALALDGPGDEPVASAVQD